MRFSSTGRRFSPVLLLFSFLALVVALTPLAPLRAAATPFLSRTLVPVDRPYSRVPNPPAVGITVINFNDSQVPAAAQAGAQSTLLGLFWSDIEPVRTNPPTYHWGLADERIQLAVNSGIEPFILVTGNPAWAFNGPYKVLNEEGRRGLAQMSAAAVARYKAMYPGKIRFWSFYNEPDCSGPTYLPERTPPLDVPSSCYGNYGAEYTKMLQEVYPAVKGADPNALVTVGGLAYDRWDSPDFSESFLDDMLASGGGHYFDVMNFHFYHELAYKWNAYGPDVVGKTNYIRGVMAKYGVSKPIVLSEIGLSATLSSPATQADYLIQGMTRGYGSGNSLVIWYQWKDDGWDWEYGFGVVDRDGVPRPSHTALGVLSKKLAGLTNSGCATTAYPGVEAYTFNAPSRSVIVAWSNDANTKLMHVTALEVTRTERTGSVTVIRDADDGQTDNRVLVTVGTSPIFIEGTLASTRPTAALYLPQISRGQSSSALC